MADFSSFDSDLDLSDKTGQDKKVIEHVSSLKESCLQCIVSNFDMYNTGFLTSKDVTLHRNLQFLQRLYSSRMIMDLSEDDTLDDRHLDFLVNKYLKELDVQVLVRSGCSLKAIKSRMIEMGNTLTKVSYDIPCHVWEEDIPEFVNQTISFLPNVKVLHIRQRCTDTILKNISLSCLKLTELNIDCSNEVTNLGWEYLCKGHGEEQKICYLKKLSLTDMPISESGIIFLLKNMPSLEVVNYGGLATALYDMHKDNLHNNTLSSLNKYNLTQLDLMHSTSCFCLDGDVTKSNVLNVWIELCPNIKTLYLNVEKEEEFNLIYGFSKVENLSLAYAPTLEKPHLDFNNYLKSHGARLENLQIEGFIVSLPVLIENCPKLESLVLTGVVFQSLEDMKKKSFNYLSELSLNDLKFSDQHSEDSVNEILKASPKLEKLSFKLCLFEDSEMNTKVANFCEHRTLEHLIFCSCDIDVALLESIILTCKSLKFLTIDSCINISNEDEYNIHQLIRASKSAIEIEYIEYESDINSLYSTNDDYFFDDEDGGSDIDEFDDVDEDDLYYGDDDGLYYGW